VTLFRLIMSTASSQGRGRIVRFLVAVSVLSHLDEYLRIAGGGSQQLICEKEVFNGRKQALESHPLGIYSDQESSESPPLFFSLFRSLFINETTSYSDTTHSDSADWSVCVRKSSADFFPYMAFLPVDLFH